MNSSLIDAAYQVSIAADKAKYDADVLDATVKQHAKDEEMHYAAFIANNAGDQYKQWASSSTPANARKAIEADIVARFSYKPLYDTTQDQIDLAAAQMRYRNQRTELTMYTMTYYNEFADTFGTMQRVFAPEQLHAVAQQVLPVVPAPKFTPPPVPARAQ
jgi:hypothetical protein